MKILKNNIYIRITFLLFAIFLIKGCNRGNIGIQNSIDINLRYCSNCVQRKDVYNYENIIQSGLIIPEDFAGQKFYSNNVNPIKKDVGYNYSAWRMLREVYKRKSTFSNLDEYVLHWYEINMGKKFNGPIDTLYTGYSVIEFNCGTEPFGYDTVNVREHLNWMGKFRAFTPVRKVPLDSFKLGYYSILKWLYAQETDRYKVKREKYEQFNYDYYGHPAVKKENLVLEDPWQEEFLFNAYKLVDTQSRGDFEDYIIIIEPYTLAPMHLYEVRPMESSGVYNRELIYRTKKYHINVADMAIRVYKYPALDGE